MVSEEALQRAKKMEQKPSGQAVSFITFTAVDRRIALEDVEHFVRT